MLNKRDKALMKVIYKRAIEHDDETFEARPIDLLEDIPYTSDFGCAELDTTIKALSLDDYFEYSEANVAGERGYRFVLHTKGHAFIREIESEQRAIKFKVVLSVAGVIGTFILGRIIALIFG